MLSVSASIVCTPGASARNDIRTDWHVAGHSGPSSATFNQTGKKKTLNTHPTRTRLSSGKIPGPAPGFPPVPLRLRSHTLTSIRRVHTPHALIKRKTHPTQTRPTARADAPRHWHRASRRSAAHDDAFALRDCRVRRRPGRVMRSRLWQ